MRLAEGRLVGIGGARGGEGDRDVGGGDLGIGLDAHCLHV